MKPIKTKSGQNKTFEKFFFCECHAEGMWIVKEATDKEFYFSFWGQGISPRTPRLWDRLRSCWKILRTGVAYEDQLVISSETARRIASFIYSSIDKDNHFEKTNQKNR